LSPLDTSSAVPIDTAADFDAWLSANAATEREVLISIYNKKSGLQRVTFDELQEVALFHGWVDTQTRSIDEQRYAIRFVPRRVGSNWSATNRAMARRLLAAGRILPRGLALLPDDL
jgi:uncharacterized protein YdeI (YjbR/CyaY-like superfamily)